ncbi:MAG: hypothetical protein AUI14_17115 [Actinobacteria bacterium 13_2_20CM_2_71_6]|nr:MAG: hypothetical protein AUI14_17115 [Actinobacteria bacterium 13_2_20CM_2_71_6]
MHRSRPAAVTDDRTGTEVVVRVCQYPLLDGYPNSDAPFVDLQVRYPDHGPEHPPVDLSMVFGGDLALAVGRILVSFAQEILR